MTVHPAADPDVPGRRACAVLDLRGEYDLAQADVIRTAVLDRVRRPPEPLPAELVLDLAGVAFMDSSALLALAEAKASAETAGIVVRLRNVPPRVLRVMRLGDVRGLLDAAEPCA